ncbi:MAG: 50S ribosomal protein L2 [Candidatus Cloacimonadota bacterium]|nr:50S ribosomal protein L2 [Candidatus Cloacimonadota bacterium]
MAIKKHKPNTPGQRFYTSDDFEFITASKSEKSLLEKKRRGSGRNSQGRITIRSRGGGHKKIYRKIDFKRYDKKGIPALVHSVEYDPNRSAYIALLFYVDGEKRYIVAPNQIHVGDKIVADEAVEIKSGNSTPVEKIPIGSLVNNVEFTPGKGGQIARSAGTAAQIVAKDGNYVHIKMPSGSIQKIRKECYATIGQIGNIDNNRYCLGKAGRNRWLGKRPHTRGVAMNPVDHPMGGGEGKSSGGRHPISPWGQPAKGYRTRKSKKYSNSYIIKAKKRKKK